jgi:hypothetical protein
MPKKVHLLLTLVMTTVAMLPANQAPKDAPRKKPAPLTEEEKEVLKNLKILENMELLQNFDKCRLLDLFLEIPDAKKDSAEPGTRKKEQGEK